MEPISALVFAVTYRCNARCIMCGLGRNHTEQVSENIVNKLVESAGTLRGLKVLNITGGEPFLLRNLPDICGRLAAAIPDIGQIALSSNGLSTKRVVETTRTIYENIRFSDMGLSVELSLDGPEEIHDSVRGMEGAFVKVMATWKGLASLKIPFRYLGFGCNVNSMTVDSLDSTLSIAESLGAPITFTPVVFNDIYFQNTRLKQSVEMNEKQKIKALDFFDFLESSGRIDHYYHRFATSMLRHNRRVAGCVFQNHGLFLDPSGNVFVCSSAKESAIGSLEHCSLNSLIHSPKTKKVRHDIEGICATCGSNCQLYLGMNNSNRKIAG